MRQLILQARMFLYRGWSYVSSEKWRLHKPTAPWFEKAGIIASLFFAAWAIKLTKDDQRQDQTINQLSTLIQSMKKQITNQETQIGQNKEFSQKLTKTDSSILDLIGQSKKQNSDYLKNEKPVVNLHLTPEISALDPGTELDPQAKKYNYILTVTNHGNRPAFRFKMIVMFYYAYSGRSGTYVVDAPSTIGPDQKIYDLMPGQKLPITTYLAFEYKKKDIEGMSVVVQMKYFDELMGWIKQAPQCFRQVYSDGLYYLEPAYKHEEKVILNYFKQYNNL